MSDELMKLLGAETVEEIKIGLRDLILDKFRDYIEDECRFWITSEDIEDLLQDTMDELKQEYKEMFKDEVHKRVEVMFNENNKI